MLTAWQVRRIPLALRPALDGVNRCRGFFLPGFLTVLAAALLALVHRLLDPAPIPAFGFVLGGLLGLLGRHRMLWFGTGMAGVVIGSAVHAYSHIAEGRVGPIFDLGLHVAGDAVIGILVGSAILGVVLVAGYLRNRFRSHETAVRLSIWHRPDMGAEERKR